MTDKFDKKTGSIVARSQPPRNLGTPKPKSGLAAGQLLGTNPNETTVFCIRCKTALMIVYPIVRLSAFSTYQKPTKSLGDWEAPKNPDSPCPVCKAMWGNFNRKLNRCEYLTDKGLM